MNKKDYLKDFGKRVKNLRLERKMSQDELAKKCGYESRSSINKIELGQNDLPQSKILAIAEALGVTPSYLMGWNADGETEYSEGKKAYYLDPETADIAQEIFDDPDLHALFDAAQDSQPNDLSMAADLLKRLKQTNK